MFAVVNHLHFSKPVDEFQEAVKTGGLPILQQQPGFKNLLFVKNSEDRATVILLWQDGPSAEAGAKVFGPTWFAQNFAPFLASEQQRSAGPVIVTDLS
jgi:hypothetical protein